MANADSKSTNSFLIDIAIILVVSILSVILGGGGILALAINAVVVAVIVFILSIRVIAQWDRMPVLRLGKYEGIIGPGLAFVIPIIDSTPMTIDTRVITTPFKAEKTLTKDNVPVDVEAILFWQVVDSESAVLTVQSYYNSILLASQTAMRDIIGKNELSTVLAGRDIIGEDIQQLIEERVKEWGIKAISVEIRDVTIPTDLQTAMARVATSDREKQARVILAESESLAADKMLEAAQKYERDPYAMQLRALNMMYEISLSGKNLMVFVPTETKGFSIPMPYGVTGIQETVKKQGKQSSKKNANEK